MEKYYKTSTFWEETFYALLTEKMIIVTVKLDRVTIEVCNKNEHYYVTEQHVEANGVRISQSAFETALQEALSKVTLKN